MRFRDNAHAASRACHLARFEIEVKREEAEREARGNLPFQLRFRIPERPYDLEAQGPNEPLGATELSKGAQTSLRPLTDRSSFALLLLL